MGVWFVLFISCGNVKFKSVKEVERDRRIGGRIEAGSRLDSI